MWLGQDLYAFLLDDITVLANIGLWFMIQKIPTQNDSEILQEVIYLTFM